MDPPLWRGEGDGEVGGWDVVGVGGWSVVVVGWMCDVMEGWVRDGQGESQGEGAHAQRGEANLEETKGLTSCKQLRAKSAIWQGCIWVAKMTHTRAHFATPRGDAGRQAGVRRHGTSVLAVFGVAWWPTHPTASYPGEGIQFQWGSLNSCLN